MRSDHFNAVWNKAGINIQKQFIEQFTCSLGHAILSRCSLHLNISILYMMATKFAWS